MGVIVCVIFIWRFFRAPRRYESTPTGRILNRFSKDQSVVDVNLPALYEFMASTMLRIVVVFTLICCVTPAFIAGILPLSCCYWALREVYRRPARELQRLDAVTTSPVLSHFSETLAGLTTIRAYGAQQVRTLCLYPLAMLG
jgi:ATP-binding cassette subfamily C (CFTR/MRP) protein 1